MMKKIKYILFYVLLLFLFGTNALAQDDKTNENVQKEDERCDFSEYSPIQMRHFPKEALIKKVSPKYPQTAIDQSVEGNVSVKILINEKGTVEKACALYGEEVFWEESEKAALKWKFKPKYGFAFTVKRLDKPKKRYAFAFIGFTFKLPENN